NFGDPSEYYADQVVKDGGVTSPAYRDLAWRRWNNDLAPTFARDLAAWLGPQPYECSNKEVLLGGHRAGKATYLLFANNAQDRTTPRGVKHELIPAETTVKVPEIPGDGLLLDLFNGTEVPVENGRAHLRLAAGDGACWAHVPRAAGPMTWSAGHEVVPGGKGEKTYLQLDVNWEWGGYVPLRLRLFGPAGNRVEELFRTTATQGGATGFRKRYAFSPLAAPGEWKLDAQLVTDPLNKLTHEAKLQAVPELPAGQLATVSADSVS